MSGIFGIINKSKIAIKPEWMDSMAENLKHRGHDGQGIWIDEWVGFGNEMLFISPESKFEKLPLSYKHWVITADARLYNREELFIDLEIPLDQQATITDSLIIIKSFEKWDKKCLDYLVGDFAFAIWDTIKKELFCATDHSGVGQFHYYDSEEFFVFCTEIKAIAKLEFVTKILNENKLKDYLLVIFLPGRYEAETFFVGIKQLMSANWLSLENEHLKIQNYWQPKVGPFIKFKNEEDYAIELRRLIERAIRDRIRTDYPIGISLSGGLDSSSIACIAARQLGENGRQLHGASSVMPLNHNGHEEDEREYINLVSAQEKNIVPYFVSAEGKSVFKDIEKTFEKSYTMTNSFYYMDDAISEELKKKAQIRVLLSGYVGDKTVSNQGNMVLAQLFNKVKFRPLLKLLNQRKKIYHKNKWQIFMNDVIWRQLPIQIGQTVKRIYGTMQQKYYGDDTVAFDSSKTSKKDFFDLNKIYQKQYKFYPDIYKKLWDVNDVWFEADINTRLSIYQQQAAYPFADKRIIDFLFKVPAEFFLMGGWNRGLIRKAMDGILPQSIQYRKDKSSYSPDYQSRIIDEKLELLQFLNNSENKEVIHKYIDIKKIKDSLYLLKTSKNWNDFDTNSITNIFAGIQAIKFINWLSFKVK